MQIKIVGKKLCIFALVILIINLILFIQYINHFDKERVFKHRIKSNDLPLIYPFYIGLSEERFEDVQVYYTSNYTGLRSLINEKSSILLKPNQSFGYYFESLNSGTWIGLNEKEKFFPFSLRKIPLVVSIYKMEESGAISFDQEVLVEQEDLDSNSGDLFKKGYGHNISIKDLIYQVLHYSDNTAANTLYRVVGSQNYLDTSINMGISVKTFNNNINNPDFPISAKEYSNVFRTLYYSSYIQRDDSQEILSLLSKTNFSSGLPAKLPEDVVIAHKIGYALQEGLLEYNDCGIIYYSRNPYILCIMTKGMKEEESNIFISELSKITYDYVDNLIEN